MSEYRKKVSGQLFIKSFANLWFLGAYTVFWYVFQRLCQYGGVTKRVPVLAVCIVAFLCSLLGFVIKRYIYLKRELPHEIFTDAQVKEGEKLHFTKEEQQYAISLSEIKKVKKSRKYLYFFLTGSRMVILDKRNIKEYDLEFLQLFISRMNPFKKVNYQLAAYLLLLAVTVWGCVGVVNSAQNFNGKLSWKLLELKQKRSISLQQDNLYETGLDGVLEALEDKLNLPEHLMMTGSMSLKFSKDGSIKSFDTHLAGFDSHYSYVNSYLITYNAEKSHKMEVYVQDNQTGKYEEEKDFIKIVRMCGEIPFEETVKGWEGEEFGVLSYGERNFGYNTEGVRYIDKDGRVDIPLSAVEEVKGLSVSVYIPQQEDIVIPVRYIYCENVAEHPNVTRRAESEIPQKEEKENSSSTQSEIRQKELPQEELSQEMPEEEPPQEISLTRGYPLWSYSKYPLEDYGIAEEMKEEYGCKHDIRLYSVLRTKYQLSGESEAIKKINEYLCAEEEEFMEQARAKAEEIENDSDSPCICQSYATKNGFYFSDSAAFRVSRIIAVEEETIQLCINRTYFNGNAMTTWDELFMFSLETGEKLELSDVVKLSKKKIRNIINKAFEEEQGFYTFEDGKTAADLWFDNQGLCGFYILNESLIFHFDESVFPWEEEKGMSVEVIYPLT